MKHLRTITLLLILLLSCSFAVPAMAVLNPSGFADYEYTTDYKGNAIITRYKGPDTDVVIPTEIDGHPVVSIGTRAFMSRSDITSVVIPDGVTEIDTFAFCKCFRLTTVVIPESVTFIGGYCFADCSSLSTINLPSDLKAIHPYTFYRCESLCELEIPQGLETIEAYALCNTKLSSVDIPDSLTRIDSSAFAVCLSLSKIRVPSNHPVYTAVDDVLYDKTAQALVCYPEAKPDSEYTILDGTRIISAHALDCTHLTNVLIPDSVVQIQDYAFAASDLITVVIPAGVTVIPAGAFYNCFNLSSVSLPDGITNIGESAFYSCYFLCRMAIPKSVSFIGPGAFAVYESETGEDIPNPYLILIVPFESSIIQYCEENGVKYSYSLAF